MSSNEKCVEKSAPVEDASALYAFGRVRRCSTSFCE